MLARPCRGSIRNGGRQHGQPLCAKLGLCSDVVGTLLEVGSVLLVPPAVALAPVVVLFRSLLMRFRTRSLNSSRTGFSSRVSRFVVRLLPAVFLGVTLELLCFRHSCELGSLFHSDVVEVAPIGAFSLSIASRFSDGWRQRAACGRSPVSSKAPAQNRACQGPPRAPLSTPLRVGNSLWRNECLAAENPQGQKTQTGEKPVSLAASVAVPEVAQ